MNFAVPGFFFQLQYLFTHLTLADMVDMALVAALFFIALQALRLRRAFQLLRGAVVFAILGVALLLLLPLTTFSWLLRGLLLASLIGLPVLFQEELRQALTGLGRLGRRSGGIGSTFDKFQRVIIQAVQSMSAARQGALIVLEGETLLNDIIATGILIRASDLSQELLLTLFNPKTPLHDGALILRGDQLMAAGCILPVQTETTGAIHLGTRHRAALGLSSQVPDALVIVVSEETGKISIAQAGRLYQGLKLNQLEEWLDRFRERLGGDGGGRWDWLFRGNPGSILGNLAMAAGLAVVAWVSIVYQTNPPQQITISDVSLIVVAPGADLELMTTLPKSVTINVQTTREGLAGFEQGSVQARLDLGSLPAGVTRVPIQVSLADPRSQVAAVTPAFVDVTLEPRLGVSLTPRIEILDLNSLPTGYSLGAFEVSPETVTVQGPQSQVERVAGTRAQLTLAGRFTSFQETLTLELLDADGQVIPGLKPTPGAVLVSVPIRQAFFTREIAVQAQLQMETLEPGYGVRRVELTPPVVTLTGDRAQVEAVVDFLTTAPISLTGVLSDLTIPVPLILPQGVSALDSEGDPVTAVSAKIEVAPVTDYLVLTVRPEVVGLPPTLQASFSPDRVSVLLIGPKPLIVVIQTDPNLVMVEMDVSEDQPGTYLLPLRALAPSGISIELFPQEMQVIVTEN